MDNVKDKNNLTEDEVARYRHFKSLNVEEKLNYMERLNRFMQHIMPKEKKEKWQKLKDMGF